MELQFKKLAWRCLGCSVRDVQTQELTQELRLTDGMPDIGRVLSGWAQMVLRSKEWRGDMITVTGGVMVWVLYAPEDGTEVRCMDGWIPFQLRWNLPDTDREGPVRISPVIRFVDSRTVSARKFMVRVGVAALAEALYPDAFHTYLPEEIPEDVEILRRTYPVRLPKEAGEKTFLLDEDLSVPGNMSRPEKLISYTVQPEIFDCKVTGGKVVFRGSGNLHLVYRCEEGKIRTWDFELPFSQYSDLEESYSPDAQADVRMVVTSLELDLEEGQLRLKCGLVAQYLVDDRELLELVEDAYSPHRDLQIASTDLTVPAILENRKEQIVADQIAAGSDGEPVDLSFYPDYPRQRRTEDGIDLEIPGLFQMLYRTDDGTLQSASARWEGKVSIPAGDSTRMDVLVLPAGRPQAAAGAEGMNLEAGLRLQVQTASEQGIPMVTGLELGEMNQTDQSRPSLILCRPGGESLWNLAKRTGSTVAAIRHANQIEEEPQGDRMLLIPVS